MKGNHFSLGSSTVPLQPIDSVNDSDRRARDVERAASEFPVNEKMLSKEPSKLVSVGSLETIYDRPSPKERQESAS